MKILGNDKGLVPNHYIEKNWPHCNNCTVALIGTRTLCNEANSGAKIAINIQTAKQNLEKHKGNDKGLVTHDKNTMEDIVLHSLF